MRWRVVDTFLTAPEAHIVAGRLEAGGLKCWVLFVHPIRANWTLSFALVGVRRALRADQFDEADELLRRIRAGECEALVVDNAALPERVCPRCGSAELLDHPWLPKLALVGILLVSLPIPYTNHLYT